MSDKVNTVPLLARTLIGLSVAAMIALAAVRARALSASGGLAATLVGTVAVAAGWDWAVLLVSYFVASSALTRLGRARKAQRVGAMAAKSGPRDGRQVLANGLIFLACASAVALTPSTPIIWMALAAGSLAASAADTWATEIGTWIGQAPRSIVTGRRLAVGESGGVTLAGTAASVAGAAFVAGVALACRWPTELAFPLVIAGVAGSLIDSVVGATLQRRSWCDACHQTTEMEIHTCGATPKHSGGIAWLDNDGVNLVATVGGALIAAALAP